MMDDLPQLAFESEQAWEEWLEAHHAESDGVWLKFAKKGSGASSVSYAEAVTAALCFGWIDSQSRRLDDQFYVQRFTPRRARSKWSKVNCARALELIAQGRMRPAGLREVEAAQADGRWEAAYDSPSTAAVPDDLRAALAKNPGAQAFFAQLDSRNRYAILHRIQTVKRPETRQRRIAEFVMMLAEGRKLYD
jgi:uncharacterized protein YdeI (YjbR/CyaY-like superfamily)